MPPVHAPRTNDLGVVYRFLNEAELEARREEIVAMLKKGGHESGAILEKVREKSTDKAAFDAMAELIIRTHLSLVRKEGGLLLVGERGKDLPPGKVPPIVFASVLLPGDSLGLDFDDRSSCEAFCADKSGYGDQCTNMGRLLVAEGSIAREKVDRSKVLMMGVTGTHTDFQGIGIATGAAAAVASGELRAELDRRGVVAAFSWVTGESGHRCGRAITRAGVLSAPLVVDRTELGSQMSFRLFHLAGPVPEAAKPLAPQHTISINDFDGGIRAPKRATPFYGRGLSDAECRARVEPQFKDCQAP